MKSRKKKILISVLIVFAVFLTAAAGACIWQWDNLNAFVISRKYDRSQILAKMQENDQNLKKEVEKYFNGGIRDFTEEEKELIASGKVSEKQILAKILSEMETTSALSSDASEVFSRFAEEQKKQNPDATVTYNPQNVIVPKKKSEVSENKNSLVVIGRPSQSLSYPTAPQSTPKPTAETIISKYVSQLYSLESKYISAIEGVVAAAKSDAKSQGLTRKDTSKLLAVGANYTNVINSLEASCDGEVEGVISNLTSELNEINADTSIIQTIRSAYENEKALKRAYYMNMVY